MRKHLRLRLLAACLLTAAVMTCAGCTDKDQGSSSSGASSDGTVRDQTQSRNEIYEQNPSDLAFSSDEAEQLVCVADPETNTPACPLPPK